MKLSRERQGELSIGIVLLFSGLFPILSFLSFRSVSPFISLSVSSLFTGLFFAVVMTLRKRWHELSDIIGIKYALAASLIVGVVFYLLNFLGIRYTSPGNVSLLGLSEVFFSFLLFHVWKKEYIPREHIVGAALILFGACIVLLPTIGTFNAGNLFVIIACAVVPFGNMYAQMARKRISTETLMMVRGFLSSIVLFILAVLFHQTSTFSQVREVFPILMINGVVMLGAVTFLWVEGIHRISVTKANAINSMAPLLTLLFAWKFLGTAPNTYQMLSFIPMFIGVLLLGKKS